MSESWYKFLFLLSRRWLVFLTLALIFMLGVSLTLEWREAQSAVQRYVGIWEDDIVRARIFNDDSTLQDKILQQLKEVHGAVQSAEVKASASSCRVHSRIPLSYDSLPVGEMLICYGFSELLLRSLFSPMMLLGTFLVMMFFIGAWVREAELAFNREVAEISRQVAHDMRGPLTALANLSRLSHELSEDKRDLLCLAVERITGIAEDLLKRGEARAPQINAPILSWVEDLVREYRLSYPQLDIHWRSHLTKDFSESAMSSTKLKRLAGNLINNAIEALPEKEGRIDLVLFENDQSWSLQIIDNGRGIPEEMLTKVLNKGFSFGKTQGHGLGLYDAQKTIRAQGGKLEIVSRLGVGTQVSLCFPKKKSS